MFYLSLGLKKFHCLLALLLVFLVSCFLYLISFASLAFSADHQAFSAQQTMLILDGSGSMWGKIKDGHKILVARKAIAGAIRPFEGKLNLGLMSYGHRKRAACLDIQLLKQTSPLNPLQYSRIVNRIKPIGKTPITSTLNSAVKILNRKGPVGSSIILLADGPENCRKDPCSLITAEFAKRNKLIVHVIAFSMLPKDAKSLRCLSKNSGGSFHTPSNKETLEIALTAALNSSLKGLPLKAPINKKPVPKKIIVKPGIKLSAHLGAKSPALKKGISWKIEKLTDEKIAESDLPPWTSKRAETEFDLSPGAYRIVADFDDYQVIRDIEIKKNRRELARFVFDLSQFQLPAGWALPDSRSGFGKLLLERQADLRQKTNSPHQKSETLLYDLAKTSEIRLIPAGTYKVSGIENGKMKNWFLHAAPGKLIQIPIWQKTGRIRFDLKNASNGTALSAPYIKIYRTDLKPDKLVETARSRAKAPQFDLAPGKYLAHITDGYSSMRHSFSIKSGDSSKEALSLEQGSLKIQISNQTPEEAPHLEVLRIQKNSDIKHITDLSDFQNEIKLSPGKYRLIYRTSQTDGARIKDVEIKNDETKTVKFASRQTLVSFLISKRSDALSRHQIFWQLFDQKGTMVWQSVEPKPSLYLSAGTYKIVAEIGNDKFRSKLRIKGRKPKIFDLSDKQIN
jgi:Ca-activated chloride channel family protein